jgi:PAS domain S-box-containing protein
VPFSSAFQEHPLLERMLRVRHNAIAAYGIALLIVAVATLARWLVGGHVMEGTPFITFYPAIILAALLGGFGPGVLATFLSAMIAWLAFMPPASSFELVSVESLSLLLFVAMASINVILVALLKAGLDRLATQQSTTRALIESAPTGIVVVDEQGHIKLVNASAEKLFGYSRNELLGKNVDVLVPPTAGTAHQSLRESFQQRPETRTMGAEGDLSGRRKDGSEFPVEIALKSIYGNGRHALLTTVTDISERMRAQDHQQLLIRELHHRTRNLFSIVQSIVTRSLVEGQTMEEAKRAVSGRLMALAQAHATLAEAAWAGAPLAEILQGEVSGFAKHFSISGCDVVVNAAATQQLALIVHELATNAVKYGALSAPDGRISIEGRIEQLNGEGSFLFLWTESGGPPVSTPMHKKGFGTVLLLDGARQVGRHVAMNFHPQGLSYELRLPLSMIGMLKHEQVPPGGEAAADALRA